MPEELGAGRHRADLVKSLWRDVTTPAASDRYRKMSDGFADVMRDATLQDMKARETPHRRVPARELARHTARLLDEVLAGETIEVTRAGRPVAVLTPIDPVDRDLGAAVDAGILDPAVLQDEHGAELEQLLARLAATRQADPESSATRALLAMRDEEDR